MTAHGSTFGEIDCYGGPALTKGARLTDAQGFTWDVHEVTQAGGTHETPDGDVTQRRESSLYFFSRYATKKLSEYPPNWTELPSAELEKLCEQALPLTYPRPTVVEVADQSTPMGLWDEPSRPATGLHSSGLPLQSPTSDAPDVPL